jgi:hypothetical protein
MGKEYDIESLDSATEGVNLRKADQLISDLEQMKQRGIEMDKNTMKELRAEMQNLMDLQTSFGKAAPKEIGVRLVKLRNIHNAHMEETA